MIYLVCGIDNPLQYSYNDVQLPLNVLLQNQIHSYKFMLIVFSIIVFYNDKFPVVWYLNLAWSMYYYTSSTLSTQLPIKPKFKISLSLTLAVRVQL